MVVSLIVMGLVLEIGQVGVDLGLYLVIVDDNIGSLDVWESVVGQVGKVGFMVLCIVFWVGIGVGFVEDQVFEMV